MLDAARSFIAIALVLLCAGPALAADPQRQDLFTAGEGGYVTYRIPGLVVTSKGTLLAYCEARKSKSDWGHIDILARRSTDGGKTWTEPKKLADRPADAKRSEAAIARKQGKEGEITINNPVMIADKSGAVHLVYCIEYGRCFYARSEDDGQTFGPVTEITSAFDAIKPRYAWKVLATGPGHGIQLSTGRLLIPVWLSLGSEGNGHRPSCVSTLYSDDSGKTWHVGQIVADNPNPKNPSETGAVELADGSVMLNLRHEGAPGHKGTVYRGVTVGPDGAKDWSPIRYDEALPEPICFGTIHRYSGGKGSTGKSRILFANPHNPTDRKRQNLTIKLSEDEGKTWPVSKVLEPGLAAYSDLAVGPDGKIYCLFERGADGKAYTHLTLATFDLDWLK